jgi:hypothetical protein
MRFPLALPKILFPYIFLLSKALGWIEGRKIFETRFERLFVKKICYIERRRRLSAHDFFPLSPPLFHAQPIDLLAYLLFLIVTTNEAEKGFSFLSFVGVTTCCWVMARTYHEAYNAIIFRSTCWSEIQYTCIYMYISNVYRTRKINPTFHLAKPKMLGPQETHTHNTSIWILFLSPCLSGAFVLWESFGVTLRSSCAVLQVWSLCLGWGLYSHIQCIRWLAPLADCWEETVKTIPARFGQFFFILVVLYRRPTIDNTNSLTSGGIDMLPNHGPDTNAGGEHVQAVPLCSVKIYYMG